MVAVMLLIDPLHRRCEINVRFTCRRTIFSLLLNSLEMVTICRSDSPGRGRSAEPSYLDYGAPLAGGEVRPAFFVREIHRKMFEMQISGRSVY